jgi:hypothetical protein
MFFGYCGRGFWGYPHFFGWGGILGSVIHLALLILFFWAVIKIVNSLTNSKRETIKDGGRK